MFSSLVASRAIILAQPTGSRIIDGALGFGSPPMSALARRRYHVIRRNPLSRPTVAVAREGEKHMSAQKTMLIAACLVSAAVLANGYWSRYSLSAAGADGKSVWRIDRRTGRVSVCGALLSSHDLRIAILANERRATADGPTPLQLTPRCSDWSPS